MKTRLDFMSSSKFAKMATILTLDGQRGVRAAQSRTLPAGTPTPAYMVEWMFAIQTNILSGGKLRVQENNKVQVKGLRKQFSKHYDATQILSQCREITVFQHTPTC